MLHPSKFNINWAGTFLLKNRQTIKLTENLNPLEEITNIHLNVKILVIHLLDECFWIFFNLIVIMLMCDNIPHCKALLNFSTNIDEQKEMEVSC